MSTFENVRRNVRRNVHKTRNLLARFDMICLAGTINWKNNIAIVFNKSFRIVCLKSAVIRVIAEFMLWMALSSTKLIAKPITKLSQRDPNQDKLKRRRTDLQINNTLNNATVWLLQTELWSLIHWPIFILMNTWFVKIRQTFPNIEHMGQVWNESGTSLFFQVVSRWSSLFTQISCSVFVLICVIEYYANNIFHCQIHVQQCSGCHYGTRTRNMFRYHVIAKVIFETYFIWDNVDWLNEMPIFVFFVCPLKTL